MNYITVFLILSFVSLHAQISWQPSSDSSSYVPLDYVMDQQGNLYMSIRGNDLIYHVNIIESIPVYKELPKVYDKYYSTDQNPISLFLDFNDTLIALRGAVPYRYFGTYFLKDSIGRMDTNYASISSSYFMKYNLKGDLFGSFLDVIFQYKDKWKNDRNNTVFSPGKLIYNYFPYDEENNYALVNGGNLNRYLVYKYNTHTLESKVIFETTTPMSQRDLIVTAGGHVFAGTAAGLYHSYNDGKDFEVLLVDTSLGHTSTTGVFQSKSGDAILVRLSTGFYASYDLGKTWTRLFLFNQEVPNDPTYIWEKMDMLDTAHAVLMLTDGCYKNRTYLLTPEQGGWKQLNPPIFKMNAFHLIKNRTNRLYAKNDQCDWLYSDDEGNRWREVLRHGSTVQDLRMDSKDQLYCFYPYKANSKVLYWSKNNAQSWDTNQVFPGRVLDIFPFSDGTLMLLTSTPGNGSAIPYSVYYSPDHGHSWELQSNRFSPPYEVYQILKGPDGSFYAFISGTRTVMISKDLGKSWQPDGRFEKINYLVSMFFDEGGYFVFGGTVDGVYGIYRTLDLKQFELITRGGPSDVQSMYSPAPGVIVAAFNKSGVQITYDYGQTWTNITSDLDYDISNRNYKTNSILVDEQGRIFLARAYDGIYRTNPMAVAVDDPKAGYDAAFSFGPNPTEGFLNIHLNETVPGRSASLVLSNALGQKLLSRSNISTTEMLDLSPWPPGIYYLSLLTQQGILQTEKLVKQ